MNSHASRQSYPQPSSPMKTLRMDRATAAAILEQAKAEQERRKTDRERRFLAENAERIRENSKTLVGYVREAWNVVEPGRPYVEGWHIEAIAEHLEAVTRGEITRLLINVPPGTMKSLLTSVLWPSWEWGPVNRPELRYLSTSYAEGYVKRDSRRMRNLVTSEWYQTLWGDHVRLIRSGEMSFENDRTGNREGVPFNRMTGGRGDRVIIDDPHSTEQAESDADRATALRIFSESVPTRLNDADRSAIVIIMQRLHEQDVSGAALELDQGYVHLMLPMEFEPDRRCITTFGGKTFIDPRYREGELLFPERFPRHTVDRDKRAMGAYAVAGQFQQRPAPRKGAIFDRDWFEIVAYAPPVGTRFVRHWDLAASKKDKEGPTTIAATAGVLMGETPDGTFLVLDVIRIWEEGDAVERLIRQTAILDDNRFGSVQVSLPKDPGQAGKVQARAMVRGLAGHDAHAEAETGDKVTRARPFAAQAEAGNVKLVAGNWNREYLDELAMFPAGKLKDQVDASSGAFGRLTMRLRKGRTTTTTVQGHH